jgi:hypothetical protein
MIEIQMIKCKQNSKQKIQNRKKWKREEERLTRPNQASTAQRSPAVAHGEIHQRPSPPEPAQYPFI